MTKSDKRKRRQQAISVAEKNEVTTKEQTQHSDTYSDDDDERDLVAAASAWAEQQEALSETDIQAEQQVESNKIYSLHITQLDYDATDYDIRNHFTTNGCIVTSVRLVYDRSVDDRKLFRGVAFVDVADKESFQNALKLHRSKLLGRTMNVRPTKTKSELSNIVQRTKQKVKQTIKKFKEDRDARQADTAARPGHAKRRRIDGDEATRTNKDSDNHKKSLRKHQLDRKLTKKERNRRAAILNQRRRSKGSK